MLELQAIWLFLSHYSYDAVMELFVDFGDHMVSHYVFIIVLKAGVLHVSWVAIKHVRKRNSMDVQDKKDE